MEHDRVPTVRIVAPISVGNPHGYIVINEADLSDDHEIHGAEPAKRGPGRPKAIKP
jgi:hypothetical protein